MRRSVGLTIATGLMLAACGTTPGERGVTGGGLGAAGGTIVGAATSVALLPAVLVGTVAGGAVGALTDEEDFNLGKPIWQLFSGSPDSAQRASTGGTASSTVSSVQADLAKLGYEPGPIDGFYGPQTRSAIREYQQDHGLPVDGNATADLAQQLQLRADAVPD